MSHPKNLRIEDFTYQLAEERIARHPLNDRDASKLLIYKNGTITEDIYKNISLHIPSETLMVFNQTRVVNARLLLKKNTGSIIEVFCLGPHRNTADIHAAMLQKWFRGLGMSCRARRENGKMAVRCTFIIKHRNLPYPPAFLSVIRAHTSLLLNGMIPN